MKKSILLPPCANEKVPVAEGPFYHITDIQTRFNDFDMLGHMNNAVYLELCDLAKVRYFEAVTGGPLTIDGVCVVVVNVNISFYSPAKMEEPLAVLTRCVKISDRSFILEQRIANTATGDVKCIATTVMAGFDVHTQTGAEINGPWADALRRWEQG